MTKCTTPSASFPRCKGRQVIARFDGGDVTSDGGILLLRQLDREMGLTRSVARRLSDARDPQRCQHRTETLVRQRVFGLALGYEDLNDHHALRHDIALQTAVDTDGVLASQSTLCRFEQQADRDWAVAIHEEMIEQFIRSFRRPPKKPLYLDFDATDDRVHGQQLGRHFNGYYNHYIFLPLFVFCGDQLLVSYLRPAYRDAAHHAGAVLALLVRRLRQAWPEVKIVFRGDSGFCRPLILNWCDRHGVDYLIGLAGNKRLAKLALDIDYASAIRFEKTWEKERVFGFIEYAAKSWKERRRRVIAKSETSRRGFNPGVEPQKAWNREVGLRGYIAPLALDYDVAFFSVRVRDELVPYDEGGRTFYQNAGDTNRDGIELALGWQLADQWRLDSALTLARYEFDEFATPSERFDGNRIPGLPEQTWVSQLTWENLGERFATLETEYVGDLVADNANQTAVDSYWLVNLRVGDGWQLSQQARLSAYVGLRNLLDEEHYSNVRLNGTFGRFYEPAPGRSVYGGVELSF